MSQKHNYVASGFMFKTGWH